MRRLILFLFAIIFNSGLIAQNTFEKFYENTYPFTDIISIGTNYYFFNSTEMVKTNKFGNVISNKQFGENAIFLENVNTQVAFDSVHFLVPTKILIPSNLEYEDGESRSVLFLIDTTGNIVKKATFPKTDKDETACSSIFMNGKFFVLTKLEGGDYSQDSINLYSFSKDLDLLGKNKQECSLHTFYKFYGLRKFNKDLIAWGMNKIFFFNDSLKLLNEISFEQPILSVKIKETKLYALTKKSIVICSGKGNIEKSLSLHFTPFGADLLIDEDNNFTVVTRKKIVKLDSLGQAIWSSEHRAKGRDFSIISTHDGCAVASGGNFYFRGWALKINLNSGNYESFDIVNTTRKRLNQGATVELFIHPQNSAVLEYSIDKGNWNLICNVEADGDTSVDWTPPFTESNQKIELRLSSISNPENSDYYEMNFNPSGNWKYDFIDANNIAMWIGNNGSGSFDPISESAGFYWPDGIKSNTTAIFQDGLVWGYKLDSMVFVNGNTYRQGLEPGNILPDGSPANPDDPKFFVYKIKKGWESLPEGWEKSKYEWNFNNWPMSLGAPFNDVNKDGKYTPGIDNPKFLGNETLFYIANDLDSSATNYTFGSNPVGLEFQVTVWAPNKGESPYDDVVYKFYRIINKGDKTLKDMYLSYWTDDDLGDANDDFVGVDTSLGLGYTYNGEETDEKFGIPPAIGHMFVQTPVIKSTLPDSGFFKGKWRKGIKNLPVTSFVFYLNGDAIYQDPVFGNHEGSISFYNNQQGLIWDGSPFINPNTGDTTKFLLSGDPVSGTGWYEGEGWHNGPKPGDRRYLITTGKFSMAPNDTQEVAVAIFIARGGNYLESVSKLKEFAPLIKRYYYKDTLTNVEGKAEVPKDFFLFQNYPNPFNPCTTIKYQLPKKEHVKLIVYDMLGREVKTLVNRVKKGGKYTVTFNPQNLASGVYFYRLQAGAYSMVRKMILLK